MGKGGNKMPDYGKIPPQAIDIEKAILGALLLESNAFLRVAHYFEKPVFYVEIHETIMSAMKEIHDDGGGIDILTVTERLRRNDRLDVIGGASYLVELTSIVGSSLHLEFHCMVITDKFLLRELIRIGSEMAHKAFNEDDPSEIAEWAENEILDKFDLEGHDKASFKDALRLTLLDMKNKAEGIVSSFILTGDPEVDDKISIRERSILLVAGAEGSGKTKWVTYLIRNILSHNEDIHVVWFSMEDAKEQIVRSFISMEAHLTTRQLQSINYTMSKEEVDKVNQIADNFGNFSIEFIDHVCTIRTILRKVRMSREKYRDHKLIVIIDNLGLVTTDSFFKGTERDDYLAGKIKEMSDTSKASVFLLHHITKESSKRFNIDEGYRPRKEYIKGSTRILDYVPQAVMVNLPRKYKDLVQEEKSKAKAFNIKNRTGKFDKTRFLMEFWTINPEGDKDTKDIEDLPNATWESLKWVCRTTTLPNGEKPKVGFIIKKYMEYSIYVDEKNKGRESKYKQAKMSIYTFIEKKKYLEDYSPKKNSRSYYLYGDDMTLMADINSLFIVESVKNRDGSDIDDESIIRYHANLDYNIFKPIIQDDKENQNEGTGDTDPLSQLQAPEG